MASKYDIMVERGVKKIILNACMCAIVREIRVDMQILCVCMYVCMYVFIYVMYACTYVCMHVCMGIGRTAGPYGRFLSSSGARYSAVPQKVVAPPLLSMPWRIHYQKERKRH